MHVVYHMQWRIPGFINGGGGGGGTNQWISHVMTVALGIATYGQLAGEGGGCAPSCQRQKLLAFLVLKLVFSTSF